GLPRRRDRNRRLWTCGPRISGHGPARPDSPARRDPSDWSLPGGEVACGIGHLRTVAYRSYNEAGRRQTTEVAGGSTMGVLIWAGILSVCGLVACWLIFRRPLRQIFEDVHVDHARELFHQQREWLEARFISALSHADAVEGQRWESASWDDEVLWARDRQTRH